MTGHATSKSAQSIARATLQTYPLRSLVWHSRAALWLWGRGERWRGVEVVGNCCFGLVVNRYGPSLIYIKSLGHTEGRTRVMGFRVPCATTTPYDREDALLI